MRQCYNLLDRPSVERTCRHNQPLSMKFIQTVIEHAMACSWPPAGWPQLLGMMGIMPSCCHGHRLVPSSCPSWLLESLPSLCGLLVITRHIPGRLAGSIAVD